ncbi:Ubiquitin carboxyl-terminal hydrolase 22 [Fusarium oxysporum f. sp. albedinis]|nr:Ubiquitin carboxyl-terminal hydrolase 22 [Fusarium oxysporum f. sp. albedinis]
MPCHAYLGQARAGSQRWDWIRLDGWIMVWLVWLLEIEDYKLKKETGDCRFLRLGRTLSRFPWVGAARSKSKSAAQLKVR